MDRAIYREVSSRNLEISIEELVLRRCREGIVEAPTNHQID